MRRIRNIFIRFEAILSENRSYSLQISHVSVYSQTPFIRIIRFKIFAQICIQIFSVADPGLGTFLTPGSGMGESQHQDPGSGMNNPDHIF